MIEREGSGLFWPSLKTKDVVLWGPPSRVLEGMLRGNPRIVSASLTPRCFAHVIDRHPQYNEFVIIGWRERKLSNGCLSISCGSLGVFRLRAAVALGLGYFKSVERTLLLWGECLENCSRFLPSAFVRASLSFGSSTPGTQSLVFLETPVL